jgi:hypothetical protein
VTEEDSEGQLGRKDLLANIRRLTIAVLDNLEEGSRDKTLDQGEKRLLSSTGARLLRLWRSTLKDESNSETIAQARKIAVVPEEPNVRRSQI